MKIGKIEFDAIIFDLDGTLYCNKGFVKKLIFKSSNRIRTIYFMNKTRKKFMGNDFSSGEEFYKAFFTQIADKSNKKVENVESWYENVFYPLFIQILKKKFIARKNINEFLSVLKEKKVKLAILSDYGHVEERLDVLKIDKSLFDLIASNEEYGVLKPSKRPLLDIAEKLKVSCDKVLVVGDRDDTDGEGARLAKMHYIKITVDGKDQNAGIYSWENFIKKF